MLAKLLFAAATAAIVALPTAALAQKATDETIFVVGAIHDPANTEATQDATDSSIPALPVVYDDASNTAAPAKTVNSQPQS